MRFRLDLLILDPDPESRNRLKQMAMVLPVVASGRVAFNVSEALRMLGEAHPVDIVFFSQAVPNGPEFVREAKKTTRGKDCAYVIVKRRKGEAGAEAAQSVLEGVDGFIAEPFSVEDLTRVTDLALRMKVVQLGMREEAAMRVILEDSMEQVDKIALSRMRGEETVSGLKKLASLCAKLTQFSSFSLEKYFKLAKSAFVEATPPSESIELQAYGGVSKRVQQAIERRTAKKKQ